MQSTRLLAAVVAKNGVGSSWRKTIGSREWSRVPDVEKAYVRNSSSTLLFAEPSERVATQLGLLVTNMAKFDYPGQWETLLESLAQASVLENGATSLAGKMRALFTLKHVLRTLRTKRFVVEVGGPGSNLSRIFDGTLDLKQAAQQATEQQKLMYQKARELLAPLRGQWQSSFQALVSGAEGAAVRGVLAKKGLGVLRELLNLVPNWQGAEGEIRAFLEAVHTASTTVMPILNAAGAANEEEAADSVLTLTTKCFERMLQCVMASLDRDPLDFAQYLPFFLTLYVNDSLLAMDAATVHRIRPKRRVLVTRFLARALLCPYYRQEHLQAVDQMEEGPAKEKMVTLQTKVEAACQALDNMVQLESGACKRLVEAIIIKYIALSPYELAEWENDPEGYVRSMDVETSPDADTPRPCGVALLVCMLDRNKDAVAQTILGLAAQMQSAANTPENVLLREACYRAIGECFGHLNSQVNFEAWYNAELRPVLETPLDVLPLPGTPPMYSHILRARAIWLVGVCGSDLPAAAWGQAYHYVATHIAAGDLVVALTAVSSLMVATVSALEEERAQAARRELQLQQQRRKEQMEEGEDLAWADDELDLQLPLEVSEQALSQKAAELAAHLAAVEAATAATITHCFALVERLTETESIVRVLQLVSIVVELIGEKVTPLLGLFATALPKIWHSSRDKLDGGDGAVARLHSALMATLAHLVSRVGPTALQDAGLQSVLFPLLQYATSLSTAGEGDVLVDEAVKLWAATMGSTKELTQPLQDLLPNLLQLLQRGKDGANLYQILEGYLLLGGGPLLEPHLPLVSSAMQRSLAAALQSLTAPPGGPGEGPGRPLAPLVKRFSGESAADLIVIASVLTVMQQLPLQQHLAVFQNVFKLVAELVVALQTEALLDIGSPEGVSDAFFEVLGKLLYRTPTSFPALLPDPAQQFKMMDRWLRMSMARSLQELLRVPAIMAVGRFRRHLASYAICSLIIADVSPALKDVTLIGRVFALGVRVVKEAEDFRKDMQQYDKLMLEGDAGDPREDQMLLRRLALAQQDPVRNVDSREVVKAAAMALVQRAGGHVEPLFAACEAYDPEVEKQLKELLQVPGQAAPGQAAMQSQG